MKKKLSIILVFVLVIACLTVFTACDEKDGESVAGKSAYEIAVDNGFVGTESEWLDSLKADSNGKSAYEIAVDNGFVGTETQWLNSLKGTDGSDGAAGKGLDVDELYAAAVDNGYDGTMLDFIKDYLSAGTSDNAYAASKAIRSAVSVYSSFVKKVITGYDRKTGEYIYSEQNYTGAGSGVIYKLNKEEGVAYIITNFHVCYDVNNIATDDHTSDDIFVLVYGQEYSESMIEATYIGGSMTYDIAVLKVADSDVIRNSDVEAVTYADSNETLVGETALAIGNPTRDGVSANGISVTSGVVSVDSESLTMTAVDEVNTVTFRTMRIDTAINSGNSGGGLFNSKGELIGIVNARATNSSIENIAYAIPGNIAINVAQNLIDNSATNNKKVLKCIVGVAPMITESKAVYDETTGKTQIVETVKVSSVGENSLAAGTVEDGVTVNNLKAGDVIVSLSVDGVKYNITRYFIFSDAMLTAREGDTLVVEVLREGVRMQFTYTAAVGENYSQTIA